MTGKRPKRQVSCIQYIHKSHYTRKCRGKNREKKKDETNTKKKAMVALLVFTVMSYFRENFKQKQLVVSKRSTLAVEFSKTQLSRYI